MIVFEILCEECGFTKVPEEFVSFVRYPHCYTIEFFHCDMLQVVPINQQQALAIMNVGFYPMCLPDGDPDFDPIADFQHELAHVNSLADLGWT